jgi:glucan phosphoethanolaminetransferase (alkaline phosphatase superfamily)
MKSFGTLGMFMAGLVYGVIVYSVGYSLLDDFVCKSTHPDTCFVTQHGNLHPIVYIALFTVPIVMFTLLLREGKARRAAILSLVGITVVLMIGMFANM